MGLFVRKLYKLAGRKEQLMMVVGMLCALTAGLIIPVNALVLGYVINIITYAGTNETGFEDIQVHTEVHRLMQYGLIVAAGSFFSGYGSVALWSWSAAHLGTKVRQQYFHSLLKQSVGWFEVNNMEELIYRFETDIPALDKGLGDKIPICLQWLMTWLSSYVVAFSESWKLSLSILFFSPILFLVNRYLSVRVLDMTLSEYQAYVSAGLFAQDTFNKISTIHAFNAAQRECHRFAGYLYNSTRKEMMKAVVFGMGTAFPWVVNALAFVVTFGYGDYLIRNEDLRPGNVFPVFVGVLFALAAVHQVVFHLDAITAARMSILPVMEVLDCVSPINDFSDHGLKPQRGLKGNIDFRGVFFVYPSNIRAQVLKSFDLRIKAGESVALLGRANSGVSAVPKLIQRLYDVNKGQILIDGFDVRDYNVRWLRQRMSFITKDSVLCPISIADNIRLGHDDVTQDQIEAAAKDGYNSVVSDAITRTSGLSRLEATGVPTHRGSDPHMSSIYSTGEDSTMTISGPYQNAVFTKAVPSKTRTRSIPYKFSLAVEQSSGSHRPIADERRFAVLWNTMDLETTKYAKSQRQTSLQKSSTGESTSSSSNKRSLFGPRLQVLDPLYHPVLWKGVTSSKDQMVRLTVAQRMKLVIARALVSQPAVLLMEDVFSRLERDTLQSLYRAFNSRKQTTLLVTSLPSSAVHMGRVVVVGKGRKVQEGPPDFFTSRNTGQTFRELYNMEEAATKQKMLMFFKSWRKQCVGKACNRFVKTVEMAYAQHLKREKRQTNFYTSALKQFLAGDSTGHIEVKENPIIRLLRLQGRDVIFLGLGLILSLILGFSHTGLAFCVGHLVVLWYEEEKGVHTEDVSPIVLVFIMLASTPFIISVRMLEHYCFSMSSKRLTARIRALMFQAVLRQDLEFFDKPESSPCILAHSLIHDPGVLQAVIGVRTGALLESLSTLILGFTLAVLTEWRMALLLSMFGPLSMLGSYLQGEVYSRAEKNHHQFMTEASKVFMEAVENITTVFTLNLKQLYVDWLDTIVINGRKRAVKYAHLHGLGYAFVSVMIFVCTALFLYTSELIASHQSDFSHAFMAFSYLVFGMAGVDTTLPRSTKVTYHRAMSVAHRVFSIIDSPGTMSQEPGRQLSPFEGRIMFHRVNFRYPNVPDARVLTDFSLTIQPGTTVALVGPPGCGKSTVLKLIQRLYHVYFGALDMDDVPLSNLDLEWWRDQVCMVSDDPDLPEVSLKDVITYGDPRDEVPLPEVVTAATKADIHQYIMSLPAGYYTLVKGKDSQVLSKEHTLRLSMARAAFKNPRVLLVDSITRFVQPDTTRVLGTLKKVMEGRTCVIATNYITEITHADVIVVLSHGHIIEQGTHEQLLSRKGCYMTLLSKQEKEDNALKTKLQKKEKARPTRLSAIKPLSSGRRDSVSKIQIPVAHTLHPSLSFSQSLAQRFP